MTSIPHILIVEDESGIADTLQYALQADGFSTSWSPTAEQALEMFKTHVPALVILDIGLPDMHGFELFRRLQNLPEGAHTPMLFLTARSEEIDRVAGLELGADDYIAKPFSPRELVARVRSILRRFEKASSPAPTSNNAPISQHKSPFSCDDERMQISYYEHTLDLSRYEYRLLRLLIQKPGRVFERDELLELVWDQGNDSFDRTVDAHIKTVRSKLKSVRPHVEAIRTVRGIGYALNEDWPTDNASLD